MKKIITLIIICAICMALATPVLAAPNYLFSTGDDVTFGRPTSHNEPIAPDPMSENIRRNKDAALLPPPFGIFSGNIPTDQASRFHDNLRTSGPVFLPGGDLTNPYVSVPTGLLPHTSQLAELHTAPRFYADGSIGTIFVERTGRTIRVYHGETEENMRRGAGHFTMTSAWDGNVVLAGHNRGTFGFFDFVRDLQMGDRITYTTLFGVRTYEVFSLERVNEYDHSMLGWSAENILTLITCVENTPSLRRVAQLREVR